MYEGLNLFIINVSIILNMIGLIIMPIETKEVFEKKSLSPKFIIPNTK